MEAGAAAAVSTSPSRSKDELISQLTNKIMQLERQIKSINHSLTLLTHSLTSILIPPYRRQQQPIFVLDRCGK